MANNISKRPRTAFLSQRLFLRPDGRLSVFSERARPEILKCGHSRLRHSPAFVFEAETAASFAANDFLPRRRHFLPRRRRCRVFDRVDAALRPRLLFFQRSRAFPFACLPYVRLSDVWPARLRTAPCTRMGHSRSTSPASPRLSLRATPTSAEASPSTQKG